MPERPSDEEERQAEELARCDKCGRLVPSSFIAIELKDGAPISLTRFQWCIVCHAQRVLGETKQELEQQAAQLTQAEARIKELGREVERRQKEHFALREKMSPEERSRDGLHLGTCTFREGNGQCSCGFEQYALAMGNAAINHRLREQAEVRIKELEGQLAVVKRERTLGLAALYRPGY